MRETRVQLETRSGSAQNRWQAARVRELRSRAEGRRVERMTFGMTQRVTQTANRCVCVSTHDMHACTAHSKLEHAQTKGVYTVQ